MLVGGWLCTGRDDFDGITHQHITPQHKTKLPWRLPWYYDTHTLPPISRPPQLLALSDLAHSHSSPVLALTLACRDMLINILSQQVASLQPELLRAPLMDQAAVAVPK